MSSAALHLRAILARKAEESPPVTTPKHSRTLAEIIAEWRYPIPLAPVGVRLLGNNGQVLLSKAWKNWNRKYKTVTDWCNAHTGEPIARVISAPLSARAILRHLEWLDEYIDRACYAASKENRELRAIDAQLVVDVARYRQRLQEHPESLN